MRVGGKTEGKKFFSDFLERRKPQVLLLQHYHFNISVSAKNLPTEAPEDFNTCSFKLSE